MNREIKFRGKDYKNKWRYGDLVQEKWGQGKAIMIKKNTTAWTVLEDTIGQFTGVKDKNGKEICEGDVATAGDKNIKYIVEWLDTGLKARQYNNKSYIGLEYWQDTLEVIGNVHENLELLEEK